MATPAQRHWRAACPNCGAPVEFASAASASAVCGSCRSTLLRDGEALQRIGVSAELFDDHSPLQLGAAGRHMGAAFTVVGRQQLQYAQGRWNEWHVLFDGVGEQAGGARSGWLSEDNGAYVMAFDAPLPGAVPAPGELFAGQLLNVGGATWSVASVAIARVLAAAGELPQPPRLDGSDFTVADLRNSAGEVATLDWREPLRPLWSVGRSVRLAELALTGLREDDEKTLKGRSIECPNCGASLAIQLSTTQSVVCDQCKSVVDVSGGIGAEMQHYAQDTAVRAPQIALGRSATLALGGPALPWQVVGYAERCEVASASGDEHHWREYLLYHRTEGFNFLVDAQDGWSYARPITGVPQHKGERATWDGSRYQLLYSYAGAVTYVLGEFYWRLKRGEVAHNDDFASGTKRLNREQVDKEVTWSAGATLDAAVVAKAFGLKDGEAVALQRDVAPLAGGLGARLKVYALIAILLVVLLLLMGRCSSNACDDQRATFGEASAEYRQCLQSSRGGSGSGIGSSGGSYGGYSSGGGGHK